MAARNRSRQGSRLAADAGGISLIATVVPLPGPTARNTIADRLDLSTRSRRKLSVISRGSVLYTAGSPVSHPGSWEGREAARFGAKPFPNLDCHLLSLPDKHLRTQVLAVRAITREQSRANRRFSIPRPTRGCARDDREGSDVRKVSRRRASQVREGREDFARRCGPTQRSKPAYFEKGQSKVERRPSTKLADGGW